MTGAEYLKRHEKLKSLKDLVVKYWREAYDYTYPLRGQKLGSDSTNAEAGARSQQARIYDSTATKSVRLLASAILSGLTPAQSLWLLLEILNLDHDETKKWLDGAARTVWKNIHASNYDVVAFESALDLIISGMFAIYTEKGSLESGQPYMFQQWPLHSICVADSKGKGFIDTVYRLFTLSAEQAVSEYPDKIPNDILEMADKKPDEMFEFLQVVEPRKKPKINELPIASIHICVKSKTIVRKSGYHEMPVAVPRWVVIPDSVYSLGLVSDAIPDIITVNEIKKMVLSNADLAISGMWGMVDDGVINAKSVRVGPRKIIPMASKDSMFPLVSGAKFDVAAIEITDLQRSIREVLMSDQLQPQDGPSMTATEVHVRMQLIRQLLGPMYGRLQAEFLQPLVKRCFGIAVREGAIAEPPEIAQTKTAIVTYISPLARSQKLTDVAAMDQFENSILLKAKETGDVSHLDIYNFDEGSRLRADLLGVPQQPIRNKDDIKKLREDRVAQIKEQQDLAQKQELLKGVIPTIAKGAIDNPGVVKSMVGK